MPRRSQRQEYSCGQHVVLIGMDRDSRPQRATFSRRKPQRIFLAMFVLVISELSAVQVVAGADPNAGSFIYLLQPPNQHIPRIAQRLVLPVSIRESTTLNFVSKYDELRCCRFRWAELCGLIVGLCTLQTKSQQYYGWLPRLLGGRTCISIAPHGFRVLRSVLNMRKLEGSSGGCAQKYAHACTDTDTVKQCTVCAIVTPTSAQRGFL